MVDAAPKMVSHPLAEGNLIAHSDRLVVLMEKETKMTMGMTKK